MAQSRAVAIRRTVPARRRSYSVIRRVTRRRSNPTIPLAIVAGFAPLVRGVGQQVADGNWQGAITTLGYDLVGYNPVGGRFDTGGLRNGLYPILLGFAAHWGASKIGLNRAIGRARIPYFRI